jgi:hypothetical protein
MKDEGRAALKSYESTQWYNSALIARLGLLLWSIDARAFLPVFLLMFHLSWIALKICLVSILFFSLLEFYGFTTVIALKRFRSIVTGRYRFVHRTKTRKRRFIHG